MKEFRFEITGGFDIEEMQPEFAADGNIVGFWKDNKIIRMCVALEVEDQKSGKCSYSILDKDMDKIGFSNLNYDKSDFYEI